MSVGWTPSGTGLDWIAAMLSPSTWQGGEQRKHRRGGDLQTDV